MRDTERIAQAVGQNFRTFGGGRGSQWNPLAEALRDQPLAFAAGVDVEDVVTFVIREYEKGKQKR